MYQTNRKPNWWLLFLLVPVMLVLLVAVPQLFRSPVMGEIGDIVVVVAIFGLMAIWARANESALIWEEVRKERDPFKTTVIEPSASKANAEPLLFETDELAQVAAGSSDSFSVPTNYPGKLTKPQTDPRNN